MHNTLIKPALTTPHSIKFLLYFLFCFALGCNKSTDFSNKVYIKQSEGSSTVPLVLEASGTGKADLLLVTAYVAQQDVSLSVSILDSSYINSYNEENGTNYMLPPLSAVNISASNFTIQKGKALAENALQVSVNNWPGYVDGAQYAIPVKLSPVGNAEILPGKDVVLVVISKVIITMAAQNAGFKAPDVIFPGAESGQPLGDITIEGRFNLTKAFKVAGNWRSDIFSGYGFQFLVQGSGGVEIRFPNASFMFSEKSPIKLSLNTWTHFAITHSGGTVSLYINGSLAGSISYPGLKITTPNIAGYITGTGCTISEFRIWNYVRSEKQIKTFMCAVDPATPGLLAYWKFNEGSGSLANDATGNNKDITASGNVTWVSNVKCPQ